MLLLSAVAMLWLFIHSQRRATAPLIPLTLLRDRVICMGLATNLVMGTVMMATLVVGALFLSFALWVPRLRAWGVAIGVALHVLVPILFGFYAGLIVFTVATLSAYALFIDARDLERLRSRFPRLAALVPA